jgi:hypothetical protein
MTYGTRIFVGCGKQKKDRPAEAQDIYTGSPTRSQIKYAKKYTPRPTDDWYILSAEHNLVKPTTVLEPYNQHLRKLSTKEQRSWGETTREQINSLSWDETEEVVVLLGQIYLTWMEDAILHRGIPVYNPLVNTTGQGEQKSLVSDHLDHNSILHDFMDPDANPHDKEQPYKQEQYRIDTAQLNPR